MYRYIYSCVKTVYAAKCWNKLPEDLRGVENVEIFKHKLKGDIFSSILASQYSSV